MLSDCPRFRCPAPWPVRYWYRQMAPTSRHRPTRRRCRPFRRWPFQRLPPPWVTAKLTATPATPRPEASVMTTAGGVFTTLPAAAACPFPCKTAIRTGAWESSSSPPLPGLPAVATNSTIPMPETTAVAFLLAGSTTQRPTGRRLPLRVRHGFGRRDGAAALRHEPRNGLVGNGIVELVDRQGGPNETVPRSRTGAGTPFAVVDTGILSRS